MTKNDNWRGSTSLQVQSTILFLWTDQVLSEDYHNNAGPIVNVCNTQAAYRLVLCFAQIGTYLPSGS